MNYDKSKFRQSTSMPRFQQSSAEEKTPGLREYEHRELHGMQRRHVRAHYVDNEPRCSTKSLNSRNTIAMEGGGRGRGVVNSPFISTTVKPDKQNGSSSALNHSSPGSKAAFTYNGEPFTVPNGHGHDVAASSTRMGASSYSTYNFNTDSTKGKTHSYDSSSASNIIKCTYPQDRKTPPRQTNRMDTRLESSDDARPPQGPYAPSRPLRHRRGSSRFSSTLKIPSPLGPGHFKDDMGSDVSGLVSPLLTSPRSGGRVKEAEAQRGPLPFGMNETSSTAKSKKVPCRMDSTFGHHRKLTDPFVNSVNNHVSQTSNCYEDSSKRSSWSSSSTARTSTSATFESLRKVPTRVNLSIPPPSLSSVQGKLRHTPEAQAHLDNQKTIRESWIRTEAKKIAHLSRLAITTFRVYQQSGKQKDYDAWKRAQEAFNDATNLEKRQAERRNMFLPAGMTAMRTGQANIVTDGSVAYETAPVISSNHHGSLGNQAEGRLLGWRMAFFERVCAETKIKDGMKQKEEEEEEGAMSKGECESPFWSKSLHIPARTKMRSTLTMAEKEELRQTLVAHVEQATNQRHEKM